MSATRIVTRAEDRPGNRANPRSIRLPDDSSSTTADNRLRPSPAETRAKGQPDLYPS